MDLSSIDPASGTVVSTWPVPDAAARDALLDAALGASRTWRRTDLGHRATTLRAVAAVLRERQEPLAALATSEMGKPIRQARAEVEKCAAACEYFATEAPAMLADEPHPAGAAESYVSYLPLGTVLAIMPWNFPYWQVFRHAAPALMAGNAVVVKHAENTLGVGEALARVFLDAGAPTGLVSHLVCSVADTAEVIRDDRIAAVTLTGSTRAGASVAATAGGVWKKTVLELGGSDAFVVLDDADVAAAAKAAVTARFQNTGQSCIAAKRFIVLPQVQGAFVEAFTTGVRALSVGDPSEESTDVGPMAREDLRAQLADQLERSRGAELTVLVEGGPRPGAGWFFDPVVVVVTDPALPVWREETFGPLAPIMVARDEEHALELVNDSEYGLGGNVWTADVERGKRFARQVESGAVFVNGMTASDPRLPFGGVKHSGYGRELATVGIREFTNVQTVWVGPPR